MSGMEKFKSVYSIGEKYYRLKDPDHFSDFLDENSEGDRFKQVLKQYVSQHGSKVEQVEEDGSPL